MQQDFKLTTLSNPPILVGTLIVAKTASDVLERLATVPNTDISEMAFTAIFSPVAGRRFEASEKDAGGAIATILNKLAYEITEQ